MIFTSLSDHQFLFPSFILSPDYSRHPPSFSPFLVDFRHTCNTHRLHTPPVDSCRTFLPSFSERMLLIPRNKCYSRFQVLLPGRDAETLPIQQLPARIDSQDQERTRAVKDWTTDPKHKRTGISTHNHPKAWCLDARMKMQSIIMRKVRLHWEQQPYVYCPEKCSIAVAQEKNLK